MDYYNDINNYREIFSQEIYMEIWFESFLSLKWYLTTARKRFSLEFFDMREMRDTLSLWLRGNKNSFWRGRSGAGFQKPFEYPVNSKMKFWTP